MSPDVETFYHLSIFYELEFYAGDASPMLSLIFFSLYNVVCFKMVYLLMMPSVGLGSRGLLASHPLFETN